jgi:hypothetical protein
VSADTDMALRTFLAARGGKKGDLSRFVEEAVNLELVRQTVRDIHERNANIELAEVDALIAEELGKARRAFGTEHGHDAGGSASTLATGQAAQTGGRGRDAGVPEDTARSTNIPGK